MRHWKRIVFGVVVALLIGIAIHMHGQLTGEEHIRAKVAYILDHSDFITVLDDERHTR